MDATIIERIRQHDTGKGPTSPGLWLVLIPTALKGEVEVANLYAKVEPGTMEACHEVGDTDKDNDLVWTWDNYGPNDWDQLWTAGWLCAPAGKVLGKMPA